MKHTSITLLTLTAAASFAQSAPAAAPAFTTSGNLAFTSDYVWRGDSQNLNKFAVQGGFDVSHPSGLSAGIWASNVTVGNASLEVDVYANYGFKVGAIDASVGYIAYAYEGSSSNNFEEVNVSATYAGLTLKASKGIAGDVNTSDYYYEANYSYDIAAVKGLNLGLHFGNDRASKNDDIAVALSYPVLGFTGTVSYSDKEGANGDSITAVTLKKTF
jgi:uncharacterized protein (TIGR02001 family)